MLLRAIWDLLIHLEIFFNSLISLYIIEKSRIWATWTCTENVRTFFLHLLSDFLLMIIQKHWQCSFRRIIENLLQFGNMFRSCKSFFWLFRRLVHRFGGRKIHRLVWCFQFADFLFSLNALIIIWANRGFTKSYTHPVACLLTGFSLLLALIFFHALILILLPLKNIQILSFLKSLIFKRHVWRTIDIFSFHRLNMIEIWSWMALQHV